MVMLLGQMRRLEVVGISKGVALLLVLSELSRLWPWSIEAALSKTASSSLRWA